MRARNYIHNHIQFVIIRRTEILVFFISNCRFFEGSDDIILLFSFQSTLLHGNGRTKPQLLILFFLAVADYFAFFFFVLLIVESIASLDKLILFKSLYTYGVQRKRESKCLEWKLNFKTALVQFSLREIFYFCVIIVDFYVF